MKKLVFGLIVILIAGMAYGADHVITITVPSEKVAKALEGWLSIYPNSETWDDDADPETPEVAKYTNSEWVTEKVRRLIVRDVRRGLQIKANQASQVETDDGVAVIE